jgi:biotin synthase-like enzyme
LLYFFPPPGTHLPLEHLLPEMTLFTQTVLRLQQVRCDGQHPEKKSYRHLALTEDKKVFALMAAADLIRNTFFKRQIHLYEICNGKSGKCSEECKFCSQSKFHTSDIDVYGLMPKAELQKGAYGLMDTYRHYGSKKRMIRFIRSSYR